MSKDDSTPNPAEPTSDAKTSHTDLRYASYTRQNDSSATNTGNQDEKQRHGLGRKLLVVALVLVLIVALTATAALLFERHRTQRAMRENLPQLDGTLTVYGLAAPVTVDRDAQGVPHIHAASMDDLVFAQGFVTAQDRLWQMDLLRRHAAGQLAAILGPPMLQHDRLQRTLQLRVAAERAVAALPADQLHWLDQYARGVNASIVAQRDHLPVEFHLLNYKPAAWTPRDSILVELAMYQDLSTGFPQKLAREALAAHLSPEFIDDLYPTGFWRDHYPGQPIPDLTAPQPETPDIPLDESQSRLQQPNMPAATSIAASSHQMEGNSSAENLLTLQRTLALFHIPCDYCVAGSNAWAVSGSRTASGKPLLSNDMHLSLTAPELWYEADLNAANPAPQADFHVAGVTLPGAPFVIAGHNNHVAWGFTNLGADVQDLYIEHTRGTPTGAEFQTPSGTWSPIRYRTEVIQVRGSANVVLDVPLTRHGDTDTPILTSIFPGERRSISLRWTIYDAANVTDPFYAVDSAADWTSMLAALADWGGPAQNLIYADDAGHIGYHALGRIPIRGDSNNPTPLAPVPTNVTAADALSHEWAGYIPFDQLPQSFDPPDGILATANARVTPDGYRFPITLNWMTPYRTERIYKVLEASSVKPPEASPAKSAKSAHGKAEVIEPTPSQPLNLLTPQAMLALQTDVHSQLDQIIAERLAYAIDHATDPLKNDPTLHQAADILRKWNGNVDANATAPAIVNATREAFWPMLLIPKLAPQAAPLLAQGSDLSKIKGLSPDDARAANLWRLYTWGERGSVEEELITHQPARWLPANCSTWNNFLASVVARGLKNAHAPRDLAQWQQGTAFPLEIDHPIFGFGRLAPIARLLGIPLAAGTGQQSNSGDGTTIKQVGHAFGPSERFTADLSDPDHTTLNLVLGQSGNPASPLYMNQLQSWLGGSTYTLPFTSAAVQPTIAHTLTLSPR